MYKSNPSMKKIKVENNKYTEGKMIEKNKKEKKYQRTDQQAKFIL